MNNNNYEQTNNQTKETKQTPTKYNKQNNNITKKSTDRDTIVSSAVHTLSASTRAISQSRSRWGVVYNNINF